MFRPFFWGILIVTYETIPIYLNTTWKISGKNLNIQKRTNLYDRKTVHFPGENSYFSLGC